MRAYIRITFDEIEAEVATELLASIKELVKDLPKAIVELNLIG